MNRRSFAYRTILAGVSMHAEGYPAVLRAIDVARHSGGRVTLLHALAQPGAHPAEQARAAEERLARLRAVHPEIQDARLIQGRTWTALDDVAEEIEAELVVIGSHVHGQLLALLGATSDRVLRYAHRDVLVVRSECYGTERPPAAYARVLAATDLLAHGQAACARAAALAAAYGAEFSLLHALAHYPVNRENEHIAPENQDPLAYQKRAREQDLARLAERVGQPDARREVVVSNDAAHAVVAGYARHHGADLVVIGAQERGEAGKLLSSTADGILHHAPCDVLVVRARA